MRRPPFRERFMDGLIGGLPWALACLIIAGIVHISSILAMPWLAPKDAYAHMASIAPLFHMTSLPPTAPGGRSTPFDDPALAQAVCRYDLSEGPLRLHANLPSDELTLFSFHERYGQIYYSMNDRGAPRGQLDVLLLTQPQLDAVEVNDNEGELPKELRIVAPSSRGFILLRALAERPGEMEDARARVMSVACALDRGAGS
jgi:uncharacterized membrane protein